MNADLKRDICRTWKTKISKTSGPKENLFYHSFFSFPIVEANIRAKESRFEWHGIKKKRLLNAHKLISLKRRLHIHFV